MVQFATSSRGVIPNPAHFSRVRISRVASPDELLVCTRDPSLRLKDGSGKDDSMRTKRLEIKMRALPGEGLRSGRSPSFIMMSS